MKKLTGQSPHYLSDSILFLRLPKNINPGLLDLAELRRLIQVDNSVKNSIELNQSEIPGCYQHVGKSAYSHYNARGTRATIKLFLLLLGQNRVMIRQKEDLFISLSHT